MSSEAVPEQHSRAWLTVLALCFGGLGVSITQTVVIPIQAEIPQLLGTTVANASWVITATLLAASVSMPIAGRLGDIFGKQRVLVVTTAMLAAGSLICALSDTLTPVLVGRVMQGLALGFIPVGIAMMREVTPPSMTSTAIASMSATLGVGGAIGLPLAAWIADTFDFHALFWTSTGVALLMLLAVLFAVPHVDDANGGRLDVPGAIGLSVALVSILIAVSKGNEWGWSHGRTIGLLVAGVVVLLVWGLYQVRTTHPLVDLRVTAQPVVLLTNLAAITVGFGLLAQSVAIPQLLEMPTATGYGLGRSILQAGLWMAPAGLMMMVFAPVSSRLIQQVGAKWTLCLGISVMAVGYVTAFFMMDAPWKLMLSACIASAGVGIGYAAMPTLILNAVPPQEAGSAVGVNSLMRSVGSSVAAAVMAAALTASTQDFGGFEIPTESAFRMCFAFGIAAAVLGTVLAALIPLRRAAGPAADAPPVPVPTSDQEPVPDSQTR
jgi:MFS family permease